MSTSKNGLFHPAYRPDIDGLRAIAVLSVVIFHLSPKSFAGGFIGVDIFFVISGFLISSILFTSLENDRFSLAEFYYRRCKRILPALLLVLVASLAIGWFILLPDEFRNLGRHVSASALFISNFALYQESGYFDVAAYRKPLLHLWSLAIEEQFYIVWPLLLALLWKRRWNLLLITLLLGAVSFGCNLYLSPHNASAAFYFPVSRFWELMTGGLLAYITRHKPALLAHGGDVRALLGGALILASLLLINDERTFPGWWALLPTAGAALLISAGGNAWLNRTILSHKLMVGVGLISYPLYLWHWPLLSYARTLGFGHLDDLSKAIVVVASFALAWATYRYVERPARFGAIRHIVAALLVALAALFVVGLLLARADIVPRNNNPSAQIVAQALKDIEFPAGMRAFEYDGKTFYHADNGNPQITAFIGDSHVRQYSPRVVQVVGSGSAPQQFNSAYFLTEAGCSPIPGFPFRPAVREKCESFLAAASRLVQDDNIKAVVVGGCWNCIFAGKRGNTANPDDDLTNTAELGKLASFLSGLAARKTVYLLLDNHADKSVHPLRFLSGSRLTNLTIDTTRKRMQLPAAQAQVRKRLTEMAARIGVAVLDPASTFCNQDLECMIMTDDGRPVFRDDDHLRPFFVREQASFLDPALMPPGTHY